MKTQVLFVALTLFTVGANASTVTLKCQPLQYGGAEQNIEISGDMASVTSDDATNGLSFNARRNPSHEYDQKLRFEGATKTNRRILLVGKNVLAGLDKHVAIQGDESDLWTLDYTCDKK